LSAINYQISVIFIKKANRGHFFVNISLVFYNNNLIKYSYDNFLHFVMMGKEAYWKSQSATNISLRNYENIL